MRFTRRVEVDLPCDAAIPKVKAALGAQGFGILTEIDLAATLRAKLGIDVAPQVILGACHPELAHRATALDPRVAALLPCNVVVRAEHGRTVVEALDPAIMGELSGDPGIDRVADEAAQRIDAALETIAHS